MNKHLEEIAAEFGGDQRESIEYDHLAARYSMTWKILEMRAMQGMSARTIRAELGTGISAKGIEYYFAQAKRLLGARNGFEAVAKAIAFGLLKTQQYPKNLRFAEFSSVAAGFTDAKELDRLFMHALKSYGYEYVVYGNAQTKGNVGDALILNAMPEIWWQKYQERNYEYVDATLKILGILSTPCRWREAVEDDDITGAQMMDEAEALGLTYGIMMPIRIRPGEFYVASVSGRPTEISDPEMIEVHALTNMYHVHRQMLSASPHRVMKLTRRQREFLSWLAEGKSYQDIAEICGTDRSNVSARLSDAYKVLGVDNGVAAVARAMAYGIISPAMIRPWYDEADAT